MDKSKDKIVKFRLTKINNRTWYATIAEPIHQNHTVSPYDHQGALYYTIAVLFFFGFSIILMIASLIKKSKEDRGMSKYMSDMERIRKMEKRQMKFKSRMATMQNRQIQHLLGRSSSDRMR